MVPTRVQSGSPTPGSVDTAGSRYLLSNPNPLGAGGGGRDDAAGGGAADPNSSRSTLPRSRETDTTSLMSNPPSQADPNAATPQKVSKTSWAGADDGRDPVSPHDKPAKPRGTTKAKPAAPPRAEPLWTIEHLFVIYAVIFTLGTSLFILTTGLSKAKYMHLGSFWHMGLAFVFVASAITTWVGGLTKKASPASLRAILLCSYTISCLCSHLANEDRPDLTGQLQCFFVVIFSLFGDTATNWGALVVTAASWVFGCVVHSVVDGSHRYTFEFVVTPCYLALLAHFPLIVSSKFRTRSSWGGAAAEGDQLLYGDVEVVCQQNGSPTTQSPALKEDTAAGYYKRMLTNLSTDSGKARADGSFVSRTGSLLEGGKDTASSRTKPSATSSDGAFFVAPRETIHCRLSAVCRSSVDGMVYRGDDDEAPPPPAAASIPAYPRHLSSSRNASFSYPLHSNAPAPRPPLRPASTQDSDSSPTPGPAAGPHQHHTSEPEGDMKTSRSFSITSHQSLNSEQSGASSYVSFIPAGLKRVGDGNGASFMSPKRNSVDASNAPPLEEVGGQESELDDAEAFTETDNGNANSSHSSSSIQSLTAIIGSKRSKKTPQPSIFRRYSTGYPRVASIARRPVQEATPRDHPSSSSPAGFGSPYAGSNAFPNPVRPPVYGGPTGTANAASPNSSSQLSSPTILGGPTKSEEENRKDATETMEIVKSVVQLDFSTLPAGHGRIPFQSLSPATLQKLVVLFTRLSEELDTFRIQRFITACIVQVLHCERASIFLCDWKNEQIWTISDDGHEIRVPMAGSLAGYAALHKGVLNIKDAYRDARFNKDVDKNTGYVTRNLLVYPISRGFGYGPVGSDSGSVIAVVEAINKEKGTFTSEDEAVLALLGKQAGIHMVNAQVYQQLQVEGMKTQSLLEVSKEINDVGLDLGAMMSKIMSRARQVLTVERASIFLVDEQKRELWSILTDSETAAQLGGDNVLRLGVGVGLAGHVAMTGEVLNIPDAYDCDLFNPEFDRKTGFVTKATLCVPVKPHHANKVMGVIQFINKCNGESFHEADVQLALSFSSFVGISLNNILLYEELREGEYIREKNKELVRLRDQAKQAAEAKSNFLMAMSHEIRTPMSGVIGMCELLMNTQLSGEQQEMTDTIRSCGEALMAIINDVLDYGRLDAGKLELEQRSFSLVNILEETIDVIRPKTEAKSIKLMLDVDPSVATDVVGDVYRLRQVLTNLLGNAVKFTPNGGDISLHVRPRGTAKSKRTGSLPAIANNAAGKVEKLPAPEAAGGDEATTAIYFSVCDTGIGIEKSAQEKLFRPFEQADAGTTRQYGGSGLGLAICKQLVEAMEGEIGIESTAGRGSNFWFTAVFKGDGARASPLSKWLNEIAAVGERKTVLLACSHMPQLAVLLRLLSVINCAAWYVSSFTDLTAALESLPSNATHGVSDTCSPCPAPKTLPYLPHVVLTDEDLDGLTPDGLEHLGKYSKQHDTRVALLMSMSTKTVLPNKEAFSSILTKPPKLALLASLFAANVDQSVNTLRKSQCALEGIDPTRQSSTKILVAEDNPTNQLLIKKQLAGFGITPRIVGNGQEAVDALTEMRYGLIFMDCHMPVLDGYGAAQKIRDMESKGLLSQGQPPVVIVALTADALPHTRGLCVSAGMNDYITKPLRRATLKGVLDTYYYTDDEQTPPGTTT